MDIEVCLDLTLRSVPHVLEASALDSHMLVLVYIFCACVTILFLPCHRSFRHICVVRLEYGLGNVSILTCNA